MKTGFIATTMAAALLAVVSMTLAEPARADNQDNDPRHIAMKTLGKNMKTIGRAVKSGNITPDLQARAAEISEIAGRLLSLFPKGKEHQGSRAKPEIWSDAAGFKTSNDKFILAASGLVAALKSGDAGASKSALKATGKNCGGCHKAYRLPKK
jgi:cytochrome c556